MFERTEISEMFYEGVVDPYYLKIRIVDAYHAGHTSKMREVTTLSKSSYNMSGRDVKRK